MADKHIILIPETPYIMSELRVTHEDGLGKIFKHPDFFYAYSHTTFEGGKRDLDVATREYVGLSEDVNTFKPAADWIMGIWKTCFRENKLELAGVAVLLNANGYESLKNETVRVSEIGFFMDVEHQGRGIAAKAETALVKFAAEKHGLTGDLWASVAPDNTPSIKSIEKLGLEQVDYFAPGVLRYRNRDGQPDSRCIFRGPVANVLKL